MIRGPNLELAGLLTPFVPLGDSLNLSGPPLPQHRIAVPTLSILLGCGGHAFKCLVNANTKGRYVVPHTQEKGWEETPQLGIK